MASMTIRRLDDALESKLRLRAASHGHSMEEEAREILRAALGGVEKQPDNLAEAIRELMAPFGGVDLAIPARGPVRDPPDFGP